MGDEALREAAATASNQQSSIVNRQSSPCV
jgi:hypothetical protein